MSLTADETADLAALKSARIKLVTGKNVVEASYNGFDTKFGPGDIARIDSLIEQLERKRDGKCDKARGAMRFKL